MDLMLGLGIAGATVVAIAGVGTVATFFRGRKKDKKGSAG